MPVLRPADKDVKMSTSKALRRKSANNGPADKGVKVSTSKALRQKRSNTLGLYSDEGVKQRWAK